MFVKTCFVHTTKNKGRISNDSKAEATSWRWCTATDIEVSELFQYRIERFFVE